MKQQSWRIDADRIDIGEINTGSLDDYIVATPDIEEFLQIGRNDDKFFIVAPKGLGKTLLLKVKSQMYRTNSSGYTFFPENELVEKLTKLNISFSTKDIERFKTVEVWEKVWWLTLTSVILLRFGLKLPPDLKSVIGDGDTLNTILGALLNERAHIDRLYEYVATNLRPKLQKLRESSNVSQIAFFIDNVDESLEMHTGENVKKFLHGESNQPLSEIVWKNAQLALLLVIKQICQTNKHIKIFASCRSEAFVTNSSSLALQLEDLAIILDYSKEQIRDIFEQNVNLMDHSKLTMPDEQDPVMKLLGFGEIPHKFALNKNDEKRKELVFDYLYRHTFGRPREIVAMGRDIARLDKHRRNVIEVCRVVNERSKELLEQYKKEVIPYFPKEVFKEFCELAESNVISFKDAYRISDLIKKSKKIDHAFSYFWRLGLIGVVQQESILNPTLRQVFEVAGTYNNSPERKIPESSDYFVLHPAMDRVLRDIHGVYFYNSDNIIGNEYLFHRPRAKSRSLQHTHIGLERDDYSIVLPELNRTRSIALVVSPSPSRHELRDSSELIIQTTNNDEVIFSIVHDDTPQSHFNAQLTRWQNQNHNILLYTNDQSRIEKVLRASSTLSSTHLGTSLRNVIQVLKQLDSDFYLYYFQRFPNPTNEVEIKFLLNDDHTESKVTFVPSLVDRLTYSRSIKTKTSDNLTYNVVTEPYGRLIMQWREGATMDSNNIVRRIRTLQDEEWYREKYLLLNEGVYRLFKVMRKQNSIILGEVKEEAIFEMFYNIQIARLWDRHDPKSTELYSGQQEVDIYQELLDCAQNNLRRFQSLKKKQYRNTIDSNLVLVSKRSGMFPNDEDFFRYSINTRDFSSLELEPILVLRKYLDIGFNPNFSSVFISYNTNDSDFARQFDESLQKRGVRTFLFEKDKPSKNIESIMTDEINAHDKILFVASKDSLQSPSCQFELTQGRLKGEKDWSKQVYITISLDNYIFELNNKHDIANKDKREEYWKNIEHLKSSTIYRFKSGGTISEFEQEFEKLLPSFASE